MTADGDAVDQAGDEELVSERLTLQRPRATDVDAILAIHRDPRACLHNPSDALSTREQAERLFERWDAQWQRFGYGYWVVRRRDTPAAIGFCGFKTVEFRGRRVLNLFYRLEPGAWGEGYASEAGRLVVDWAANRLVGEPLIARVRPANIASQRVALRAGLVRAEHLDQVGADGLDWLYAINWPE